ncbi:MAG: hypothetical protein Q8Q12_12240 [bacterium]|nr:hypothetical protein [bacterium]
MVKDSGQKLIRLSAARAKVRLGYASVFAVCLSGFLAGFLLFSVSAAIYLFASDGIGAFSGAESPLERLSGLAELFGIRLLAVQEPQGALVNIGVLLIVVGIAGAAAAMILRRSVRSEPTQHFFKKKLRMPLDGIPFALFFAHGSLSNGGLIVVYLACAVVATFLWRFWHRVTLSVISSLNVDRLMPKPV